MRHCGRGGDLSPTGGPKLISRIAKRLRASVPASALAPDEEDPGAAAEGGCAAAPPGWSRDFAGYSRRNTIHVDSFLYPRDSDVDRECRRGGLSRHYCGTCGSRQVQFANVVPDDAANANANANANDNGIDNEENEEEEEEENENVEDDDGAENTNENDDGQSDGNENEGEGELEEEWDDGYFFCVSCGSRTIRRLNFITHSASREELRFMFSPQVIGPTQNWNGKTIVDVGSRLGAVLYYAYAYTNASQIVGIEKNKFFYDLQQSIVSRGFPFLSSRIHLVHADVLTQKPLLQSADMVIMHNVFEWFVPLVGQVVAWRFIFESVCKPGCILITIPSIEHSLSLFPDGTESHNIIQEAHDWVEEVPLRFTSEDVSDVHKYIVKHRS
ncbi:bromodomain adjacent to zinc finger domain protein 1A [Pelomyxa schiedti]|nr:bromodomain adjacent to zinc finger domain protein 1A [Pelomyxa schiedti]